MMNAEWGAALLVLFAFIPHSAFRIHHSAFASRSATDTFAAIDRASAPDAACTVAAYAGAASPRTRTISRATRVRPRGKSEPVLNAPTITRPPLSALGS